MKRPSYALVIYACAMGTCLWSSTISSAEIITTSEGRLGRTTIRVNHSETLRVPSAYADIVVGSPEIADVLPIADRSIYILAKKIGTTNVTVFAPDKRLIGGLDVQVTPDNRLVESRIRSSVRGARGVRVTNADGALLLAGQVDDAVSAERAMAIAAAFSTGAPINAMQIASPQQVLLEVRVVDASRNAGRELGVRWDFAGQRVRAETGVGSGLVKDARGNVGLVTQLLSGSTPFGVVFSRIIQNGGATLDVTLQALEEKRLVRRLASPNLTALSGSTASFLAGGEFPVPVGGEVNGLGAVTSTNIVFKKFGVMLEFMPTVLADGQINLRISPEVSELDYANVVRNVSITIPSIVVRRASTEVVLRSGQSFAVAGLMAESGRTETAQLPWIGAVPVLGALFRSQSFQKRETELVILVTAHLAHPATPSDRLSSPTDRTIPANDIDFFVNGRSELEKNYRYYVERGQGIVGPYGHVLDIRRTGKAAPLVARY